MKIYQMSEKKKRTYKAVGIFYVLVFAAVLVVKPCITRIRCMIS